LFLNIIRELFEKSLAGLMTRSSLSNDDADYWRERIFLIVLLLGLVAGTVVFIPSIYFLFSRGELGLALADSFAYAMLLVIVIVKRIGFRFKAGLIAIAFYVLGTFIYFRLGPYSGGPVWLFIFPLIAGVLLGVRGGFFALGLNAVTFIVLGAFLANGQLAWAAELRGGVLRWVVYTFNTLFVNALATVAVTYLIQKITEGYRSKVQAQEAVRESEKHYRELFNSISDLIYTQDLQGRFLSLNAALANILGYEPDELIGVPAADMMEPQFRDLYKSEYLESVMREGSHKGITKYFSKDGTAKYIEYNSSLVTTDDGEQYISGIGRDVTERVLAKRRMKVLQEQLRHAQKMEAVGTLAGGIAHDFNNILAAITGYSELAIEDAQNGEPVEDEIKAILKASGRAKDLVQKILEFSRKAGFQSQPMSLNKLVLETVEVIERTIPKMITIELDLNAEIDTVEGDRTQIEQILLNLASNARDAMGGGGTLSIETSNVDLDERFLEQHSMAHRGAFIRITVSDTGGGMDATTLSHIFEPFYTTKEVGKGTGLGLASTYGIVKSHKGQILCESTPGEGTIFRIYLPALAETVEDEAEEAPQEGEWQGKETVLVVDDEAALREIALRILRSSGYQVLLAQSGEEALELLREQDGEVDLVILDINMPGMGGLRCLELVRKSWPNMKVIIASGYSKEASLKSTIEMGAKTYVTKPFRMAELLTAVRQALDEDGADSEK
jgi:two-component system cell cycle sensor histidine kinase/response regulator CckA